MKLGIGLVIKVENDWRDVQRPQVAMRRNCYLSSYYCRHRY